VADLCDGQDNLVVAFYIGRRNNKTLNVVVKTLLNARANNIYTDKLGNYQYLIPKKIHITKRYGTNGIERKISASEPTSEDLGEERSVSAKV